MKIKICTILAALYATNLFGQTFEPSLDVKLGARVDWQQQWTAGSIDNENSGFNGNCLVLWVDGNINRHFKYSWRQRLEKTIEKGSSFFDGTDWVNVSYMPNEQWTFSGGKEVVAIGGFEYDRSPLDLFTCGEYLASIPCYQFGISATYTLPGGLDSFTAQVSQSPWSQQTGNKNMYGYNLLWKGKHGLFSALYSLNILEYARGKYISYISLGNRLDYRNLTLELDLINRAASHQTYLFKDFSMTAELAWHPGSRWRVYAKTAYDVNRSGTDADYCVLDGTEIWLFGAGIEYHPFITNKHDLRLHGTFFHTHGTNANPDGMLPGRTNILNIGLAWKFDILHIANATKNCAPAPK